jgi:DNA modification methylase
MQAANDQFLNSAIAFARKPYGNAPFSSRNWGNPLHSLCSYQGKLKPAIAHFLISNFTEPGDSVLDPLSGAGTIPLEAMLQGRIAHANDIQELGYILSLSKVAIPDEAKLESEKNRFLKFIEVHKGKISASTFSSSNFGMNGKILDYYHVDTLNEVLAARNYILANKCDSTERALVFSAFLHILHGNRPYALSRKSHPVTPFKPSGEYEYRDVKTRLNNKINKSLAAFQQLDTPIFRGSATLGSFEGLNFKSEIDAVITSPPFADSTRFYIANWLRLWAAGWEAEDFKSKKIDFIEEKQKQSFEIYETFFEKASQWLKPGGKLILHLGKTSKVNMADKVLEHLPDSFKMVSRFDEDVSDSEKFGIRDQGSTNAHQFIFLRKI